MTVVGGDPYTPGDEVQIWVNANQEIFGKRTWGMRAVVVDGPYEGLYTLEAEGKKGRFKSTEFVPVKKEAGGDD